MLARAHDGNLPRSRRVRRGWRARAGKARRGVSDVVATILLLGLTVTLFASIFAFVTRFPSPPAQSVDQFQASLVTSDSKITELKILQSGGPLVPESDHVYLVASRTVTNWQFSQALGIPVSWGTGNVTTGWGTGQYWTTTFNPTLAVPTNITIYIVSPDNLLFTTTVPGTTPNEPAVVTGAYTDPTNPGLHKGFQIFADVSGSSTNLKFNISFAGIPGLSTLGTPSMTYNSTADAWYYQVASGESTTNGTYIAFIQGTNTVTDLKISGSVSITIGGSSASGGGSGSSSAFSVTVGMSLQPPPASPATTAYFWASVTYSGSSSGDVNITFYVNQTSNDGGHFAGKAQTAKFYGIATTAIKGPGTVTIYSSTEYPTSTLAWLFHTAVKVQALAVPSGGITTKDAVGSTSFNTQKPVTAEVCASSGTTECTSTYNTTSWVAYEEHTNACTTSTCPYLVVQITNGYASSVYSGGISVTGTVYANTTGHDFGGYTVASFTIAAASTSGESATLTGMTNNRFLTTDTGTYTLVAFLTVTAGGVTIGYICATMAVTVDT